MPHRRKISKPKTTTKWVKKTNWLDLPPDVTANILHRLGVIEILESAQKVCTSWRKISKDPAMWRVIDMQNLGDLGSLPYNLENMCMHAIDRSQGQLVGINIEYFGTDELMEYLAQGGRSSQLKSLQISHCYGSLHKSWSGFLKNAPLLEEIALFYYYSGRECCRYWSILSNAQVIHIQQLWLEVYGWKYIGMNSADAFVLAVAKGMSQLLHLQLTGSEMTNKGLQAILDGCCNLQSLDLRGCCNINLNESCGKLCREQIKDLRLPRDSMDGHKVAPYNHEDDDIDAAIRFSSY